MSRNTRIVIALSLAGPLAVASADVADSARLLPADTAAMLSIESMEGLKAALKRTSYYELYRDPAMQEAVGPAEKKVRERMDRALQDLWKRLKIENPPRQIPWPQGRVVVAVFVSAKEAPARGMADLPPTAAREGRPERFADLQVVALMDMGKALDQARGLAQDMTRSLDESGTLRKRQQIRGVDFQILTQDQSRTEEDVFCFGFKDSWLIAGTSVPRIEAVLRHVDRDVGDSLATQRGFQTAVRTVGQGEVSLFVHADPIRQVILDTAQDRYALDRQIRVLGLDQVSGLAACWQVAPGPQEVWRCKALVGVTGPKQGIPALLCPASAPMRPDGPLFYSDAVTLIVAHYDLAAIYDRLAKLVTELSAVNIDFLAQTALAPTGEAGGPPPLNLRQDVLAHLSGPQVITWRMDRPYTDPGRSKTLGAIAVRDAEGVDTALARIHRALVGKADPKLQRTMLEHTLYLLPPLQVPSPFLSRMAPDAQQPRQFAAAVAAGVLAAGEVDVVEQAIRGTRQGQTTTIGSDPMFRHAMRFLPSEAGVYWYQNTQRYWEIVWAQLKGLPRTGPAHAPERDMDDEGLSIRMPDPWEELGQVLDPGRLPEFSAVRRYLGAESGCVRDHADGIAVEVVEVRPPQ
ncbi:MAG: hypothetical protein KBE04_11055 [Phycisphaerae bacterium]|nr:hypothetical protein [Phycisphaerae bacterium]